MHETLAVLRVPCCRLGHHSGAITGCAPCWLLAAPTFILTAHRAAKTLSRGAPASTASCHAAAGASPLLLHPPRLSTGGRERASWAGSAALTAGLSRVAHYSWAPQGLVWRRTHCRSAPVSAEPTFFACCNHAPGCQGHCWSPSFALEAGPDGKPGASDSAHEIETVAAAQRHVGGRSEPVQGCRGRRRWARRQRRRRAARSARSSCGRQ